MPNKWLVLDIGNTHTVAGVYEVNKTEQESLIKRIRFRTDPHTTADEYHAHLSQLFSQTDSSSGAGQERTFWQQVERVIASTVVPSLENVLSEACRRGLSPIPCLLVRAETRRNFELDLPFPAQLGADRMANVAGALTLAKPPFLIVDAGTATTFCLVDDRPAYIGGAITPGLETGWKALQSRAARLFSVELTRPTSTIGATTETQLQSGVLHGYEVLIEGMTDRMLSDWEANCRRFGRPFLPPTLFATGGCLKLLKLSQRFRVEPDLTLLGLIQYGLLTA